MKTLLIVFYCLLSMTVGAQLVVSDPMVVANENEFGNARPRIALNASNEPVIIWCDGGAEKIYCSRMISGSFTPPQQINPDGIGVSSFDWSGPEIASFGNKMAVVMKLEPEMTEHVYVVLSEDGGASWSDTVRVESSTPYHSRMPSIAFDEEGNPSVAFLRENMEGFSEWAYARSIDGGQTFEAPTSVSVAFTGAVCDCCPSSTVIDGDRVAVLYRNNENNLRDIRASISSDGGLTFPIQGDVDNLNWQIFACPATGPSARIIGDKLCSVWMSDATGDSRIYYSTYDLSTSTFEGSEDIYPNAGSVAQNFPAFAGEEGMKAIAWESIQAIDRNILFTYSTSEDGFNGTEILTLTESMSGYQIRPNMAYANGVFHIVFSDDGGDAVIYMTVSGIVSVEEEGLGERTSTLEVFPNPASTASMVQWTSADNTPARLELYTSTGALVRSETVLTKPGINQFSLFTGGLAAGTYTLRLFSSGSALHHRLVRE